MSVFGDELRRLRLRSGLSQEILATRAGLSTEAVSLLERGRRTPRMTTLGLLAGAMSLDDRDRAAFFATATSEEPYVPALPTFSDRLLGREDDMARVAAALESPEPRLLTLVGPAGVGKTRLALGYAAAYQARYAHGGRWLPLGTMVGKGSLVPAVVAALGLQGAVRSGPARLADLLRGKSLLLVIDNADHQPDECIALTGQLMEAADALHIIVASRHQLQLPGEQTMSIGPLDLPPPGTPADELSLYAASRLFLTRAALGDHLNDYDAEPIIRICQRVDGLPLALELAAARTTVLTVRELADTLDGQLDILRTSGPAGQGSLADSMVEWSYQLLAPHEKLLFARLGVFSGGFSREAVTAVCGEGLSVVEVLEVLSALVSKSLVARRDLGGTHARFRLLHLIGHYARDRLNQRGDAEATFRRHAAYFANLAEHADRFLLGHDQQVWLSTLDDEIDNISSAIHWASDNEPETALRLTAAMRRWCYLRGRYSQGRTWAAAALAAWPDAPPQLRAPVLHAAGMLAFLQCDYADAHEFTMRARELFVATGDTIGVLEATSRLGAIGRERGEYDLSDTLYRLALQMADDLGDDHQAALQTNHLAFLSWIRGDPDEALELAREARIQLEEDGDREGVIWALMNLGVASRLRGDLESASLLLGECEETCNELAFREGSAWLANQLGVLARLRGDLARATELQESSLTQHRQLGDRWREASVLDELAAIAVARGALLESARLLGMADRLRAQIAAPVPTAELADREATVSATRAALGAAYDALTGPTAPE